MTQPESMKTRDYVYGVQKVNGNDAWALFTACAAGDMAKVKALLAKDQHLVNAQLWYQFPIHLAVREGHAEIVKLLLERGSRSRSVKIHLQLLGQVASCRQRAGFSQGRRAAPTGVEKEVQLHARLYRPEERHRRAIRER